MPQSDHAPDSSIMGSTKISMEAGLYEAKNEMIPDVFSPVEEPFEMLVQPAHQRARKMHK